MTTDQKIDHATGALLQAFEKFAAGSKLNFDEQRKAEVRAQIRAALQTLFKEPDLIEAAKGWAGRAARLAGLKKIAEALGA